MHRINIFCGNYGSGKTEISLNTALALAKEGHAVTLVDLDIVNPYFRSSEQTALLEAHGVQVYCPTFANTSVDVPSLPAQIQSIFADRERIVVIDVGGDDTGATALGRYHNFLAKDDVCAYLVVNARRPFSKGVEELETMLHDIEAKARISMDYIINNTNMARNTGLDDLLFGREITDALSLRTGKPIAYVSGLPALLAQLPADYTARRYPLNIYMRPEWLDDTAD